MYNRAKEKKAILRYTWHLCMWYHIYIHGCWWNDTQKKKKMIWIIVGHWCIATDLCDRSLTLVVPSTTYLRSRAYHTRTSTHKQTCHHHWFHAKHPRTEAERSGEARGVALVLFPGGYANRGQLPTQLWIVGESVDVLAVVVDVVRPRAGQSRQRQQQAADRQEMA